VIVRMLAALSKYAIGTLAKIAAATASSAVARVVLLVNCIVMTELPMRARNKDGQPAVVISSMKTRKDTVGRQG
jgi:hypothetical protein